MVVDPFELAQQRLDPCERGKRERDLFILVYILDEECELSKEISCCVLGRLVNWEPRTELIRFLEDVIQLV